MMSSASAPLYTAPAGPRAFQHLEVVEISAVIVLMGYSVGGEKAVCRCGCCCCCCFLLFYFPIVLLHTVYVPLRYAAECEISGTLILHLLVSTLTERWWQNPIPNKNEDETPEVVIMHAHALVSFPSGWNRIGRMENVFSIYGWCCAARCCSPLNMAVTYCSAAALIFPICRSFFVVVRAGRYMRIFSKLIRKD